MHTPFTSGLGETCKNNFKNINPPSWSSHSSCFPITSCQCLLLWVAKIKKLRAAGIAPCQEPQPGTLGYTGKASQGLGPGLGLRNVPLKSAAPKVAEGWRLTIINSFESSVFSSALPDTKLETVLAAFCLLSVRQQGRDLLKFSWQVFAFIPGSTTGESVE